MNAPGPECDGNSVTMLAFSSGNVELAKFFLENGGEPSTVNEEGDNCFTLACEHGHVKLIEMLLEKGLVKLFGPMDEEGNGALHLAAQGHVDTLKLLLDKGAFINVPAAESKATALHMAVMSAKVDNVKLLLSKGADASKVTVSGLTPLMCCCNGDIDTKAALEMAALLLDAKADVNKAGLNSTTAYDLAEASGSYAVARFLLSRGAVPKAIPANTAGIDTFNSTIYYQAGQVPVARTRAASVVLGNMLYLGGGIRARPVEELEAELMQRGDEEIDEMSMMPFAPLADLYSADLTKIGMKPLIADLSKAKATFGSKLKVSTKLKGDHVEVSDDNTIVVAYVEEDCCGSSDCTDAECHEKGEKKEGDDKEKKEHEHEENIGNAHSFVTSVMAEESFTAEHTAIAYFEVTVTANVENPLAQPFLSVGFTSEANEWEFEKHPGWTSTSIGYHSDDGRVRVLAEDEEEDSPWIGQRWGLGDTIGAGYIFETKETFFTLNGRFLGIPLSSDDFSGDDIRPIVGASSDGVKLSVNFGSSPFRFNFHAPTITWTKLNDLPDTYLALLPLPGSTDELLVIPDSTKAVYHYNPSTQVVQVKECKASKIPSIPLHAEHSVNIVGNKVVLFARQETILEPTKGKNGLLMILDLATLAWNNVLSPINIAQKKLVKAIADLNAQLSATAIGNNYYILSPEKAYTLNLANLSLTNVKMAGLPGNEDMGFTAYDQNRAFAFALAPNMTVYRFHLLDAATKQWLLPRFTPSVIEPVVGKSIVQHDGTFFAFGGFSSSTASVKSFFSSFKMASSAQQGIATAFNAPDSFSDAKVVVGSATYQVHKVIASVRSSVLAAAFANSDSFTAPESLNAEAAHAVLKYLYSDSVDISLVSAKDYKAVVEAVKALAPEHEDRIVEELMFSVTLTRSTFNRDILTALSKFESLSDITIETNGAPIKAHRVILANRGLKDKVGSGSSFKLEFPEESVKQFVTALYAVCDYNIAAAPRSTHEDLISIGKTLSCPCLERCITVAKTISVPHDEDVPAATPL